MLNANRASVRGQMWLLTTMVGALALCAGCPTSPSSNNAAPVANAGTDQAAAAGAGVALNGSSSSDADGDSLTFAWAQTAGANVTLTGANTATPTFTAPNAATTLTFELTVSDGTDSDTDSVNVTVTAGNSAPLANAGPNQAVATGEAVALDGQASSDPNGDALTFSWTQTAGTVVVLAGANTATPSFTAPNVAGVLTFELTVDDGQATGTDTVDVGVEAQVQQTPILFIANLLGSNVTAYDIADPNTINGNIPPGANLAGGQTQLNGPADIVVDSQGALLAVNVNSKSITSYREASDLTGINGNVAPDRNVSGAATLLNQPATLAIQSADELLFVGDLGADAIFVYGGVSTNTFNGNLAPLRTITSPDINDPIGINLDANGTLYVANRTGGQRVSAFANAANLNGNVAATRVITSASFTDLFDVFIDANDRMYVVDFGDDQVHVFNNASTRNGNIMPDVTLTIPGAGGLTAVAVDTAGVGYVVDALLNAVYSYNNLATRNGSIAPDRTLQGANTQLSQPIRVFLLQ